MIGRALRAVFVSGCFALFVFASWALPSSVVIILLSELPVHRWLIPHYNPPSGLAGPWERADYQPSDITFPGEAVVISTVPGPNTLAGAVRYKNVEVTLPGGYVISGEGDDWDRTKHLWLDDYLELPGGEQMAPVEGRIRFVVPFDNQFYGTTIQTNYRASVSVAEATSDHHHYFWKGGTISGGASIKIGTKEQARTVDTISNSEAALSMLLGLLVAFPVTRRFIIPEVRRFVIPLWAGIISGRNLLNPLGLAEHGPGEKKEGGSRR